MNQRLKLLLSILAVAFTGILAGIVIAISAFSRPASSNIIWWILLPVAAAILAVLLWVFTTWLSLDRSNEKRGLSFFLFRTATGYLISAVPLALYLSYYDYNTNVYCDICWPYQMNIKDSALVITIFWLCWLIIWQLLLMPSSPGKRLKNWFTGRLPRVLCKPSFLLLAFSIIWLAVTTYLHIRTHYSLFTALSKDTSFIDEAFWSARSGSGFFTSTLITRNTGGSIFGIHADYAFLLYFPFYLIWPSQKLIIFLSNAAMASAVIPIYLFARHVIGDARASLIAAAYLLFPSVLNQATIWDVHDLNLFPIIFLLCFLAFYHRRFKLFLLLAFLTVLIKEDLTLTISMFGIYALFARRSWKWVVSPIVLGGAWLALAVKLLIPYLSNTGSLMRAELFSNLGGSWSEIIKTTITNPMFFIKETVSTKRDVVLLYGFFTTLGMGLPLLSGYLILSLPSILIFLVSYQPFDISSIYAMEIAAVLLPAMIIGISRLHKWSNHIINNFLGISTATAIALIILSINISSFFIWLKPESFKVQEWTDDAHYVSQIIPPESSAVIPSYLSTVLSEKRVSLYTYSQSPELPWPDPDYIIIDKKITSRSSPEHVKYFDVSLAAANDSSRYELFEKSGDLYVYRAKDTQP